MKSIFTSLLGLLVAGFVLSQVYAQANKPASAGVYTAQQAERGKSLYQSKCAMCHSDDLTGGGTAPSLAGDDFIAGWSGQPLANLFDTIHTSMPADQPGSLTMPQAADIVSYLLSFNKFPPGQTELSPDDAALKQILIDKAPAAPKN